MTEHDITPEKVEASLSERIESARARSEELAANAPTRAYEFIQDHPVATIAGGIALGALIAGVFATTRTGKAAATAKQADKDVAAISARLSHLASIGADLALAYAARAATASKANAGKLETRLSEQFGHLSDQASEKGAEAGKKVASLADVLLNTLKDEGETALARMNKIKKD